jgi:mono/diheme cytochrome c family protein
MKGWLDDNCVSCHKADGPNVPDLSTYEKAKAQIDAILESIQNADIPMPPKGLPKDEDVEQVQAWKEANMPKTAASGGTSSGGGTGSGGTATGGTGTGGGATAVTYENFVRGWLSQNCASCHKPGATPPDLSTYQAAKAGAQRSLARSSGKDPKGIMPPGAQAQPADVLAKLEAWISGGSKEK